VAYDRENLMVIIGYWNSRRSHLEIFYDILTAIKEEYINNNDNVKLTRVQHRAQISYDKMRPYIVELQKQNLISSPPSFSISEKATQFLTDYKIVQEWSEKIAKTYFS
jgi:predicted transcriptional regulator